MIKFKKGQLLLVNVSDYIVASTFVDEDNNPRFFQKYLTTFKNTAFICFVFDIKLDLLYGKHKKYNIIEMLTPLGRCWVYECDFIDHATVREI